MNKKWIVELTKDERDSLVRITKKGKGAAYIIKHANILLKCDQGEYGDCWTDTEIADAFNCRDITVRNIRKRFIEDGLDIALGRKKRTNYTKKISGDEEAKIIALACSEPPEGYSKWSLRLLADKIVELEILDEISHTTVGLALKKTNLSLG